MSSNPPDGYPRISPYLNYEDTGAMLDWLARAFGLVERHRMSGAEILEEPADQPHGDRRYGARDPEGHRWYFASRRE